MTQATDFAFDDVSRAQIDGIIAKYPPGRQASAVLPLLDLAQRQMGRTTGSAWLLRLAPQADVRLLSAFDPDVADGTGLPDPWYGPPEDFDETIMAVEAAMPGLIAYLRTRPEAAPAIIRE